MLCHFVVKLWTLQEHTPPMSLPSPISIPKISWWNKAVVNRYSSPADCLSQPNIFSHPVLLCYALKNMSVTPWWPCHLQAPTPNLQVGPGNPMIHIPVFPVEDSHVLLWLMVIRSHVKSSLDPSFNCMSTVGCLPHWGLKLQALNYSSWFHPMENVMQLWIKRTSCWIISKLVVVDYNLLQIHGICFGPAFLPSPVVVVGCHFLHDPVKGIIVSIRGTACLLYFLLASNWKQVSGLLFPQEISPTLANLPICLHIFWLAAYTAKWYTRICSGVQVFVVPFRPWYALGSIVYLGYSFPSEFPTTLKGVISLVRNSIWPSGVRLI